MDNPLAIFKTEAAGELQEELNQNSWSNDYKGLSRLLFASLILGGCLSTFIYIGNKYGHFIKKKVTLNKN